jgi:nucleotide-binding universal stress UspA family protein
MFQHILLPTDGSASAEKALHKSLAFARDAGARVTGLHVSQPFHVFSTDATMLEDTREQFAKDSQERASIILAQLETMARELGVPCTVLRVISDAPYEAIIAAAQAHDCDLIAMASHGRRGIKGMLIGSETQKVLTHSVIPVLVYR